jgi:hypothetical protein
MKTPFFCILTGALACLCVLDGCTTDDAAIVEPMSARSGQPTLLKPGVMTGSDMLNAINVRLATEGKTYRVLMLEYITAPASGHVGTLVFAKNVGNKQLSAHWVPYDLRRRGDRFITYAVDPVEAAANGGVTAAQTGTAIDNAMSTWNDQSCSTIPITRVNLGNIDLGFVQWLEGFGGIDGFGADITHAGWLPGDFFDAIAENGSQLILGATFTFIWTEGNTPTDIDYNGKADVAFREIYYNNVFTWSVAAPAWYDEEYDVESIALHESGHGLSQAHFGNIFVDASDKTPPYSVDHLHFAPRAVMNAMYWDTQRFLLSSDVGGHCSIWASWPVK